MFPVLDRSRLWYDGNWADPPWHPDPLALAIVRQTNAPTTTTKEPSAEGTVELKVPFCCDGVISKVRKKLNELDGVASINYDIANKKLTVKGPVKREKVLKQVKTIKQLQRAEFWETKKSKK